MSTQVPPRPDVARSADVPSRPDLAGSARGRRRWVVVIAAIAMTAVALGAVLTADPHGAHAFLARNDDGTPLRWDPCTPIRYEVNYEHAPEGASADVREAVARVAEASGIEFVDEGITDRTVDGASGAGFAGSFGRPLPVLISWLPRKEFAAWASPDRADAFGLPWRGRDPGDRYVSGMIVLLATDGIRSGFENRSSLGPLLMHEWGHVLGLAHVTDGDELMWSPRLDEAEFPDLSLSDWGPGDLEGLAEVGRPAGCLPSVT